MSTTCPCRCVARFRKMALKEVEPAYTTQSEVKHLDCISICFEIFRFAQDDKMKVNLCFDTPSLDER